MLPGIANIDEEPTLCAARGPQLFDPWALVDPKDFLSLFSGVIFGYKWGIIEGLGRVNPRAEDFDYVGGGLNRLGDVVDDLWCLGVLFVCLFVCLFVWTSMLPGRA